MKTRVIAATALLPLLLAVVLFAPKFCTAILFGLMAAIAAYELLVGTGLVKNIRLCCYSAATALWCVLWCGLGISTAWLLLGILAFWVVLFAEIMVSEMKLPFEKIAACFVAGIVVPLLLGSIIRIHMAGPGSFLILIPFVLSFLSDTGAYFVGLRFGRHKLAPTISPKKTIEGMIGGVLGAVVGMLLYCLILNVFWDIKIRYGFALIYGILGSVAGVFGDLCFSAVKRQTGIKDYGNLIPGHGGILDRFDSMIVVGPVVEILLALLPVVKKW